MSMGKFLILMWLCSATTTIHCKQIQTDRVKFIDEFDCTVYGYSHSTRLMRDFGREKVNEFNLCLHIFMGANIGQLFKCNYISTT